MHALNISPAIGPRNCKITNGKRDPTMKPTFQHITSQTSYNGPGRGGLDSTMICLQWIPDSKHNLHHSTRDHMTQQHNQQPARKKAKVEPTQKSMAHRY